MTIKLFGAVLILLCSGSCGFSVAASYRRDISQIKTLIQIMEFIQRELEYRLTPLPELCMQAGEMGRGAIFRVFTKLSDELSIQAAPDVPGCMRKVLQSTQFSRKVEKLLNQLGKTLGQYDLSGQLQGLSSLIKDCSFELSRIVDTQDERIRSYRTLGLCTGAALVILFI